MIKTCLFFCLFLICFNNIESKNPVIVDGDEAAEDEALFYVGITDLVGFVYCGGTLYHGNKVLTAAHCVIRKKPKWISIKYGTKNRNEKTKLIRAAKIVTHPEFNNTKHRKVNDIAVITLSKFIEEGPHVQYAQLQTEQIALNEQVTVYGWGRTNAFLTTPRPRGVLPKRLLKGTNTVIEREDNKLVCDEPRQHACKGDSGGPLVSSDGKVCGIVSHGKIGDKDNCTPGTPTYYTEVSAFIDWIKRQ